MLQCGAACQLEPLRPSQPFHSTLSWVRAALCWQSEPWAPCQPGMLCLTYCAVALGTRVKAAPKSNKYWCKLHQSFCIKIISCVDVPQESNVAISQSWIFLNYRWLMGFWCQVDSS